MELLPENEVPSRPLNFEHSQDFSVEVSDGLSIDS
jgi:hypothetical protein